MSISLLFRENLGEIRLGDVVNAAIRDMLMTLLDSDDGCVTVDFSLNLYHTDISIQVSSNQYMQLLTMIHSPNTVKCVDSHNRSHTTSSSCL